MIINRTWSMPSSKTFNIKPIKELIEKYNTGKSIDPFANNSKLASVTNDIDVSYDTKFSYHIVRLLLECEQILTEHDLDLEKNSDILKSIRNGEWSLDKIIEWFGLKEKSLETAFSESKLQNRPDESKIKKLLLECLEMHYGDLSTVIKIKQDENDKYVISPDMI